MQIIGDVQPVLRGTVSEVHTVDLQTIPFALGAGQFRDDLYGEAIVLHGRAHIFFEKQITAEKKLVTPFLLGVTQEPTTPIAVQNETLQDLYKQLLQLYPKGCALYGQADFRPFKGCYIKKSPIYNEPVLEHPDEYFKETNYSSCEGTLFGVVVDPPDPKGFYTRGEEEVISHTHTLLADGTRHVFNETLIHSGKLFALPFESDRS